MRIYLDPDKVLDEHKALRTTARQFYVRGRIVRAALDVDGRPYVDTDCPEFFEKLKVGEGLPLLTEDLVEEDEALKDLPASQDDSDGGFLGDIPIDTLDLSRGVRNALIRARIGTIGDLQGMSEEDLVDIPGIGPASARQIIQALRSFLEQG